MLDVLPGIKQESDLFARLVAVVETDQPHDIELFYDADGLRGWFRSMVVKLDDGIAVSFTDITDRKQYEQQLSYQAFILENVSDAIYAVDRDLNITLWSQGAEALYGWNADEVMRAAGCRSREHDLDTGAKGGEDCSRRGRAKTQLRGGASQPAR